MKNVIIVAMGKDWGLLKPLLKSPTTETVKELNFIKGEVANNTVVALQCGIGKVNADIGTMTMIFQYSPDMIINTGVAGGADKSINVMDIVVGERVSYHDVWCGPECKMGVVQGLPNYFEGSKSIISKLPPSQLLKYGLIVSGDQFVESIEKVNKIKENYPEALAVDMESAAIAHVCYLKHVPFLSVRVISDSPLANSNNMQQYKDFWTKAPAETFEILKELITKIK